MTEGPDMDFHTGIHKCYTELKYQQIPDLNPTNLVTNRDYPKYYDTLELTNY